MFILDTDIVTLLYYDRHLPLKQKTLSISESQRVVITAVTRAEILLGRLDSLRKAATGADWLKAQKRLIEVEVWLSEFDILRVDATAAEQFDRLRMNKKLKKCGHADLLIACIALANDATLVTRNTKDFAGIPNLKLENWAD